MSFGSFQDGSGGFAVVCTSAARYTVQTKGVREKLSTLKIAWSICPERYGFGWACMECGV